MPIEAVFRNLPIEHVQAAESRINQLADESGTNLAHAESQLRARYAERGMEQTTLFISDVMHLRQQRAETLYKKVLSEYLPLFFEYAENDIPEFKTWCLANAVLDTTLLPEIVGLPHVGASIGLSYKTRFDVFVKNEFEHARIQMRSDVKKSAERTWKEIRWEVFVTLVLSAIIAALVGKVVDRLIPEPKDAPVPAGPAAAAITTNANR